MSAGRNKNSKTKDRKTKRAKAAFRKVCKRIDRIIIRKNKKLKQLWLWSRNG